MDVGEGREREKVIPFQKDKAGCWLRNEPLGPRSWKDNGNDFRSSTWSEDLLKGLLANLGVIFVFLESGILIVKNYISS